MAVGVISDSINRVGTGVAGSQASGDLPATVQVLNDSPGGSDEGRAMGEIIFDEAPGISKLVFSTGTLGAATKVSSINNIVGQGAKVIADDTFLIGEPMFQDGIVAQAANGASAAGTAYLASAGNRARQSWEGSFIPGAGSYNDFDPGAGADLEQTVVSVPQNGRLSIALQWAEPWGHASTDLDLELYNISGGDSLVTSSASDNIATGIPSEFVSVINSGSAATVGIRVKRFAGAGTPPMKYIGLNNFGTFSIAEHNTASPTIDPDVASATGVLTLGAVQFSKIGLNAPEVFSSRGPVRHLFDAAGNPLASPEIRQKPDIAAADGVATSVPGFQPFFGTSAAAPSAAGIAVLARSANPSMSVADLYGVLRNPANTIDCTASGNPDSDCGFGFVLADKAVAQALASSPAASSGSAAGGTAVAAASNAHASAVSKLKLPKKIKIRNLLRSGIPVSLELAGGNTKLTITASMQTPSRNSRSASKVVVARTSKTIAGSGAAKLRVKLNKRGKKLLKHAKRANLSISVSGSSAAANAATLKGTVTATRR